MEFKQVERIGDNGPEGNRLILQWDDQGDIYVQVLPKNHILGESVRFCTLLGGGRSTNTLKALRELFKAIEEDNEQQPQNTKSVFES